MVTDCSSLDYGTPEDDKYIIQFVEHNLITIITKNILRRRPLKLEVEMAKKF